eukprot:11422-Heterococcus_DN1.PRE.4
MHAVHGGTKRLQQHRILLREPSSYTAAAAVAVARSFEFQQSILGVLNQHTQFRARSSRE